MSASTSEFTFENLIAGVSYKFKIAAYNLLESANKQFDDKLNFSEPVEFVIANVPDQISDLSQSTQGYEQGVVKLVWSAPAENGSQITSYVVTRDVGSGVYFKVWSGIDTNYVDTGLQAGSYYNYKVKATNVIG